MRIPMAVLLLLAALPQEVKLDPRAQAGDKVTVSVESVLDLEILVKDGEWESAREDRGKGAERVSPQSPAKKGEDWSSARLLSVVRREKFSQEVIRVSEGRPSVVHLRCLSSTVQKSGTNLALGTSSTPLAGRTFVGTRSDLGWVVKDSEGRPAPAEGQSLGAWNDCVVLLPRKAVRVNEAWTVKAGALGALFFPPGTSDVAGSLECTLESVSGGRASILVKGEVEGAGGDGTVKKLVLSGSRLVFDTAAGKPLLLTINGSFESRRTVAETAAATAGSEAASGVPAAEGAATGERRKLGEILARSTRLEVSFVFE